MGGGGAKLASGLGGRHWQQLKSGQDLQVTSLTATCLYHLQMYSYLYKSLDTSTRELIAREFQ